ncbi:hypothetical protein BGZ76_004346 [Entomortierella beljakovae]|nr:hypothetical protein BGZ76_004346 [Entomortierella beljakovae]
MPDYDRFHLVYSTCLSKNPPRPKQTALYLDDLPDRNAEREGNSISELNVEDTSTWAMAVESSLTDITEIRKDHRRREQETEEREKEPYQRMTKTEIKHQEMLNEKAELKSHREALQAQKDAFHATREQPVGENAVMKRELELWSNVQSPRR